MQLIRKRLLSLLLAVSFTPMVACQAQNEETGESETSEAPQQQNPQTPQSPQQNRPSSPSLQQGANAPDIEVSDEELETFAEVAQEVQELQRQARGKMQSALEEQDMSMEEFQQLRRKSSPQQAPGQKNPPQGQGSKMSEEEKSQLQEAQTALMEIQQKVQQKMAAQLEAEGMEPQRFRQIAQALRQDKELQERFSRLQGNTPAPGSSQGG